jgi:hypothetical protein
VTFKTLIALFAVSAILGWPLWTAWTRGKIGGPFAFVERKTSPISFWLCVVVFGFAFFLVVLALAETAIKEISN